MVARRSLTLLVIVLGAGLAAWGDTPDVNTIEANATQRDARIQQISDQLDTGNLSDDELSSLLETLLGYQDDLQSDAGEVKTALQVPTQRLDDLGPPPAEGEPPDSADVARLRESLTNQVSRLTGLSKRIDLSRTSVDRLIGRVSRAQSARFRASVTERTVSPFSVTLWTEAVADARSSTGRLSDHVTDQWQQLRESGNRAVNLALLAAALAGATLLLLAPRSSRWRELEPKVDSDSPPSGLLLRRRTAEKMASWGLITAGAGALLYGAALETGFVGLTGKPVAVRLWLGGVVLVLVWIYARGVFSPQQSDVRIAPVSSRSARSLRALFVAIFGLFVADRIVTAVFELAGSGLHVILAQATLVNTLFAVLLWLSLDPKLWQAEKAPESEAAADQGAAADKGTSSTKEGSTSTTLTRPHELLRWAGRVLAVLILAATALSYIRLPYFVFHRAVLFALFLMIIWSVRVLAVWGLSRLPIAARSDADVPREDERSAAETLGFWLNLALELALLALSIPVLLQIVGFDWLDERRWFGMLGTPIRIGSVSVSFTDVLTAVVAFLIVSMGTKWAAMVVDKRLLQHTPLDAGERDSMKTLVNYAGVIVGILIALSIVGVGLSKLAIVAGALSVGIGFGLQSIVNNFVSGLILLFERPIKMGDWVVVDSGEGYVKHIGARATEIQTFDRASILIPNSELVSSAVQNWFYKGRLGRMKLPVGVAYGSDPEQVRDILIECAKRHPGVASHPEPSVMWWEFGESSLELELRFYVRNYDDSYDIRSELHYTIFKAFRDAGVEIPFPQRDVHLRPDSSELRGVTSRNEPNTTEGGESNE